MLVWIKSALSPQMIRDRLMDPSLDFQKKMVEYLEGVHQGEFILSTTEEVKNMLDHKMVDDSIPTAVESMPVPPPVCKAIPACEESKQCDACLSWEDQFRNTTNEILLRCNTHRCRGNKVDTTDTRKEGNGKNKYQPAVGCCANKRGKCKARFPRDTYSETRVDPKSGALLMKKGEPMMNFFTDIVTYLFRCNTDVTSLLSGTAIKAVVAYISDYISKPSLKTYVVFDTIQSVFNRNTTLLSSSIDRGEKARKIMTQIVNSLTSKMEIGAPMASLYLLGNPDHYTSHKFKPMYWRSYVSEARRYWESKSSDDDLNQEDNLVLQRIRGSVVGTSPVFDYIYRPLEFQDMCLYDWVRLYDKSRIPKAKDKSKKKKSSKKKSDSKPKSPKYSEHHRFSPEHPLHDSHHVRVLLRGEGYVPNFVGGHLPRHDKGDLDYYGSTMLALFVPWRSGKDLKSESISWHTQYKSHQFSTRQLEIMRNFNVRYECLDARDDYSAQLKADDAKVFDFDWATENYPPDQGEQWMDDDATYPTFDPDSVIDKTTIGKLTSKWNYDKSVIQQLLQSNGWLSPLSGSNVLPAAEPITTSEDITASQWKNRVKKQRDLIQEQRQTNMSKNPSRRSTTYKIATNAHPNEVRVVDSKYLHKKFRPKLKKDRLLIDNIVKEYTLNREQERAFRIVANHAT
ncbi:hypothetical protein BJ138DRAFT_1016813, partial [Hygrophoropsis aurantiaca]